MNNNKAYKEYERKEASKNGIKVIIILVLIVCLMVYLYRTDDSVRDVFNKFTNIKDFKSDSKIDLNKCINNKTNKYELAKGNGKVSGLSISYDGENVYLDIDKDKFKGDTSVVTGSYLVDGIKKKDIKKSYIDGIGQDIGGTTIFFLTNDKKVKYFELFNNGEFKVVDNKFTINDINGVTGVIKLYSAKASNTSGYHTVLASLKDGSFYDLALIIDESEEESKAVNESDDSTTNTNSNVNNSPLDPNNCINDNSVTYRDIKDNGTQDGITISYNGENILINIDADTFANGTTKAVSGTYNINGVTKSEVKEVYVDGIGQSAESGMVFFLLNSGDIKYFKLFNIASAFNVQNKTFTAYELKGPSNVVKLYSAEASNVTGYHTMLAAREDGKFYNLNTYVK